METVSKSPQSPAVGRLPPPPGVVPDFKNLTLDYVVASVVVCLTITSLVVWIRMYTVLRIMKVHGWADCKWLPSRKVDLTSWLLLNLFADAWQTHLSLHGYAILSFPIAVSEYLIEPLQIGFLGFCSIDIVGMHWGGGSHQWNVPLPDVIRLLKVC